jgi:GNAT superfamily N-acetyltransferase
MTQKEITYYLEMYSPENLRAPGKPLPLPIAVKRSEIPCPEWNRFFYTAIGGDWFWVDRLGWTYDEWKAHVTREDVETWVAFTDGTPVGYFELEGAAGGDVEIAYFGILPQFAGMGVGGHLLAAAVRQGWAKPAKKVWVHTSSFDDPRALQNYLARGFKLVREEISLKDLPDVTPGPWPGARCTKSD